MPRGPVPYSLCLGATPLLTRQLTLGKCDPCCLRGHPAHICAGTGHGPPRSVSQGTCPVQAEVYGAHPALAPRHLAWTELLPRGHPAQALLLCAGGHPAQCPRTELVLAEVQAGATPLWALGPGRAARLCHPGVTPLLLLQLALPFCNPRQDSPHPRCARWGPPRSNRLEVAALVRLYCSGRGEPHGAPRSVPSTGTLAYNTSVLPTL